MSTVTSSTYEERIKGGEKTLRILQYNVNKSSIKIITGLFEDPRLKEFDIIAV